MATPANVEAFQVRLPDGKVLPTPVEGIRRLIHLALLKLPFWEARRGSGPKLELGSVSMTDAGRDPVTS
jgi:hypothetical protein